jgi:hypothetical protein
MEFTQQLQVQTQRMLVAVAAAQHHHHPPQLVVLVVLVVVVLVAPEHLMEAQGKIIRVVVEVALFRDLLPVMEVQVLLSLKSLLHKIKSQSFLTQPHGMCRQV